MRLTKKYKNSFDVDDYYTNGKISSGICYIDDNKNFTNACICKLGQLEDIEEELGIDLITLYKLFKAKKVFSFSNCGVWEVSNIGINLYFKTITIWNGSCHQIYPLNEYGKSFALTKEELL